MPAHRQSLFVISYDIVADRRRVRLRKTLLRYGVPVQYSVFECRLTPERLLALQEEVRRIIEPGVDSVLYFEFCKGCVKATRNLGIIPPKPMLPVYIF